MSPPRDAAGQELAQHAFALLREGLEGDRASMNAFVDLFAEDATLWLPPTPNTHSPYRGREAIRGLLVDFVIPLYRDGLHVTLFQMLAGDGRWLFQFEDRGERAVDGSDYENSPVIVLATSQGAITGFWEYWGGPRFFRGRFDGSGARGGVDARAHAVARDAFAELQAGLRGDAPAMDRFLERFADGARLWFPPTPNTRSPYIGRDAAAKLFRELLVPMYPDGLHVTCHHVLPGGTRTAFELSSHGRRRDGTAYVNSPCLCFDVKQGRIETLWEHWGGPGFHGPA